jgi:hypothetical protein
MGVEMFGRALAVRKGTGLLTYLPKRRIQNELALNKFKK